MCIKLELMRRWKVHLHSMSLAKRRTPLCVLWVKIRFWILSNNKPFDIELCGMMVSYYWRTLHYYVCRSCGRGSSKRKRKQAKARNNNDDIHIKNSSHTQPQDHRYSLQKINPVPTTTDYSSSLLIADLLPIQSTIHTVVLQSINTIQYSSTVPIITATVVKLFVHVVIH